MLTQSKLLETVQDAFAVFNTTDVWWLIFDIREVEKCVELSVRTRRQGSDRIAAGAITFDRFATKEYLAFEVRRFIKEACGLGWALVMVSEVPQ